MLCYCAKTRQVARRLTRFYEAELRPAGVNPAQFELMSNLRGRPGASQAELATVMDVDQTTLSRNLKLLGAARWVSSGASASDGRRVEYRLTPEGQKIYRLAAPCWERAMKLLTEGLGDEAEGVFAVLERLGGAVEMR